MLVACKKSCCVLSTPNKANDEGREVLDARHIPVQKVCELNGCSNGRDQHVRLE